MAASVARRAAKPRVKHMGCRQALEHEGHAQRRRHDGANQSERSGKQDRDQQSATKAATARRGNRMLSGRFGQGRARRCEIRHYTTGQPEIERQHDHGRARHGDRRHFDEVDEAEISGQRIAPEQGRKATRQPRQGMLVTTEMPDHEGADQKHGNAPRAPRCARAVCATGYHSIARSPTAAAQHGQRWARYQAGRPSKTRKTTPGHRDRGLGRQCRHRSAPPAPPAKWLKPETGDHQRKRRQIGEEQPRGRCRRGHREQQGGGHPRTERNADQLQHHRAVPPRNRAVRDAIGVPTKPQPFLEDGRPTLKNRRLGGFTGEGRTAN